MNPRLTLDLSFKEEDLALIDQAKTLLLPLFKKAVNINEGLPNEERGFIELRECNHDDLTRTIPDVILARYEVGKGQVYP